MNRKYTYNVWQISIFKIALLSIGVAIGAHWPSVFAPYVNTLLILGIVLGMYIAFLALKNQSEL